MSKTNFTIKLTKLDRIDKRPWSDWMLKDIQGVKPGEIIITTHYFILDVERTILETGRKECYKGVKFSYSFTPLMEKDKLTGKLKLTGEIGSTGTLDYGGDVPEWNADVEESRNFWNTLRVLLKSYLPEIN